MHLAKYTDFCIIIILRFQSDVFIFSGVMYLSAHTTRQYFFPLFLIHAVQIELSNISPSFVVLVHSSLTIYFFLFPSQVSSGLMSDACEASGESSAVSTASVEGISLPCWPPHLFCFCLISCPLFIACLALFLFRFRCLFVFLCHRDFYFCLFVLAPRTQSSLC